MKTSFKLKIEILIKDDIYSDPQNDFLKKLDDFENIKYEILPYDQKEQLCEDDLLEKGLTNILIPEGYCEAAGTPYDKTKDIIVTLKKFLNRVIISDHLILIDNYIFHDKDVNQKYSNFLAQIFDEHLRKLQKVTFVTKRKNVKKHTQKTIIEKFKSLKRQINIETKYTNLFHDRLWLCGNRGMFIGTSLNGLGQKYCLIDYVNNEDVKIFMKYLSQEKII